MSTSPSSVVGDRLTKIVLPYNSHFVLLAFSSHVQSMLHSFSLQRLLQRLLLNYNILAAEISSKSRGE